jgi:hypothetical protein
MLAQMPRDFKRLSSRRPRHRALRFFTIPVLTMAVLYTLAVWTGIDELLGLLMKAVFIK